MSAPRDPEGGIATAQAGHEHPSYLAHHFESPRQQFESGKTGMWLFLSTEILLFSGLFCAYAIYRSNHPEIFIYAHQFLDKTLGGINTLILILSSLTAAWSVRAAQLGQRRLLIGLILVTLACAVAFMGIKAVEYEHKWKHGLLWGQRFQPEESHGEAGHGSAAPEAGHAAAEDAGHGQGASGAPSVAGSAPPAGMPAPAHGGSPLPGNSGATPISLLPPSDTRSSIPPAAMGPEGLAHPDRIMPVGDHAALAVRPKNVQIFFGIYFVMTGLHALHVIAGMGAFLWVLRRAIRGDFSPEYFTPVDLTALYWHLVDIIWIYLFPLLYLIH